MDASHPLRRRKMRQTGEPVYVEKLPREPRIANAASAQ